MRQTELFCVLVILLASATAMQINTEEESFILNDIRNNVTDDEYNLALQTIKQAEAMYTATDYEKIARYISISTRLDTSGLRWNVFVYEGRIRQLGFGTNALTVRKFLILLNFGKYNLTYAFIGSFNIYCGNNHFYSGTPSDQYSKYVSDELKQIITASIDDGITRKGNDIMGNSDVITSDIYKAATLGIWTVLIADPSARFGYMACFFIVNPIWFSLRAYKDFKWNYFWYLHPG